MSKSTPISQLPFQQQHPQQQVPQQQQPPSFVNDQHRQIVAQAQHAAQQYTLPQPSSGAAPPPDDDITIQEAYQYIQGHASHAPPHASPPHAQQHPLQQQQPQQHVQHPPSASPEFGMGGPDSWSSSSQMIQTGDQSSSSNSGGGGVLSWIPNAEDVRHVVIGVVAFLIVSICPVKSIMGKFIDTASLPVPHADTLVKCLIMTVALFIGRKLF